METLSRPVTTDSVIGAAFSVIDPALGIVLVIETFINEGEVVAPHFTGAWNRRKTASFRSWDILDLCVAELFNGREGFDVSYWSSGTRCTVNLLGVLRHEDSAEETVRYVERAQDKRDVAIRLRDLKSVSENYNVLPLL